MIKLKTDQKCISLPIDYCTMFFEIGFHEVYQKSSDFGSYIRTLKLLQLNGTQPSLISSVTPVFFFPLVTTLLPSCSFEVVISQMTENTSESAGCNQWSSAPKHHMLTFYSTLTHVVLHTTHQSHSIKHAAKNCTTVPEVIYLYIFFKKRFSFKKLF